MPGDNLLMHTFRQKTPRIGDVVTSAHRPDPSFPVVRRHQFGDPVRMRNTVRIRKTNKFPPSRPPTRISRLRRPRIFLTENPHRKSPDDPGRSVGGAVVHHDHLQLVVRNILGQASYDSLGNRLFGVVRGDDNRAHSHKFCLDIRLSIPHFFALLLG